MDKKCSRCDNVNVNVIWLRKWGAKPGYNLLCVECGFYVRNLYREHMWNFDANYIPYPDEQEQEGIGD